MKARPRYETLSSDSPVWASEPFRVFFPLGIAAAIFGLVLWPLHYFGFWPIYPALQHPRILVFGFGAAFVFGFLGTAWPRFLESKALSRLEVITLAIGWLFAQLAYAKASINGGDAIISATLLLLIIVLGRRLCRGDVSFPPPGFALAFLSILVGLLVTFSWWMGWHLKSPQLDQLLRLLGYQGFLLLPLIGVGSYLFPRFFEAKGVSPRRRWLTVWLSALLLVGSFLVEVYVSGRAGNLLRCVALAGWTVGALPMVLHIKLSGTRPWALQFGVLMIMSGFICRAIWPHETFAFEHFLFLGGFSQLILLVADRVVDSHCDNGDPPKLTSRRWRWIVWLMILTAATRATADLVPSTRISHHIYAAIMLIAILLIWMLRVLPLLRQSPKD